jgi:hypothetical protein
MKLCAACAVMFVAASAGPVAQSPSKEVLLRRTADYVADFVDGLSNVVAEEAYQQSFESAPGRRRLKSDFLLVKYPGMDKEFLAFRDVIEVNGKPVTDQQDRLLKLFIEPYNNPVARASEIANASARHSIDRGRLANPLFVLAQLQSHYQPRFRFTLNGLGSRLGPDVREVEMFEIRNPAPGQPPPIHALAWIEEGSGRVLKTELRQGRAPSTALTTTTFGAEPCTCHRRAGGDARLVCAAGRGRSHQRHRSVHRRGDVQPLPPLPGTRRTEDRDAAYSAMTPM